MASPVPPRVDWTTATIANGQSLSGAVDLGGRVVAGIVMPDTWTAAGLTLQASVDGVTYADVYDSGGDEVEIAADAAVFIALDPSLFAGMRFLKIRSGTSGTPVNQGGARILTLSLREID